MLKDVPEFAGFDNSGHPGTYTPQPTSGAPMIPGTQTQLAKTAEENCRI